MPRNLSARLAMLVWMLSHQLNPATAADSIVRSSFVADPLPTHSAHASTIIEADGAIQVAWFGGTAEKNKDVVIWLARELPGGAWSQPVEIARGNEDKGADQYPCWNPVLFQPTNAPLYLFYKVGPSPDNWWGRVKESTDGGKTWSKSRRLPQGIVGPVRNKPIELPDGTILCGASEEDAGWRSHVEWTRNPFWDWNRTDDLNSAMDFGAIQPTLLRWGQGRLQMLVRTRQIKVIAQAWSTDEGRTWSPMTRTTLPNPNSAIDAVLLRDGRAVLIYNPTENSRARLSAAVSKDGREWKPVLDLENSPEKGAPSLSRNAGEFSYPAVIESADGLIHVTYTWKREKIRHVVLNPASW
jgi:predicted neuraminidase